MDDFLELTVFYQQDNIFWLPKTKIFWLPEKKRWGFIRQHAKQDDIAARIDSALSTIEKCNPSLKAVSYTQIPTRGFVMSVSLL